MRQILHITQTGGIVPASLDSGSGLFVNRLAINHNIMFLTKKRSVMRPGFFEAWLWRRWQTVTLTTH